MEWGAEGPEAGSYQRRHAPGWECTLSKAQFPKQLNSELERGEAGGRAGTELRRQTRGGSRQALGDVAPRSEIKGQPRRDGKERLRGRVLRSKRARYTVSETPRKKDTFPQRGLPRLDAKTAQSCGHLKDSRSVCNHVGCWTRAAICLAS